MSMPCHVAASIELYRQDLAERLLGDHTARYYLFTGRDASPSGMLAAYRRYQARAH